ncbi:MAG: ATP-binding protein [Ginsengibacter sp.]
MKTIFISSLLLLFSVTKVAAQYNTDSLKLKLASAKEDTNKVNLLISLGWTYQWSEPDTAIMYGLQGRKLSKKLNYIEGEIDIAGSLAEALSAKGNFSQALEVDLQALQLAEKAGEKDLSGNYFSIGNVYFYSGDYKKALSYYLEAKKRIDPHNGFMKVIIGTIGESYYHLNLLDSAFSYIDSAYQIDKNQTGNHWSVPYYYMALIEAKKGKYEEALTHYKSGLLYSKSHSLDIANGYNGMANVFRQMGQEDSSIYYAKKAINLAKKESLIPNVIDASALLTELYMKTNTDSAFKYQSIMIEAKDSLFSEEKIKQLQNLSFNEEMRQQDIQQEREQFQNRLKMYALFAVLAVFLIIAFVLWRNNRHKQKAYILLKKQKVETDLQKVKVEQTLEELKSTQAQLIQSEKMASLGELTAGIAHEIQNPLNFVNNFSDVNQELIEEMDQEIDKGNIEEVKSIAKDIKENEEKINHHGKRADAIVKGMLQHSRVSTGVKEPTDINALCDEYLRLSYHGLRARDKNFNADIETDFDKTIVKIKVVPQDMGRVLLNLFNNAFYAVTEKSRQLPKDLPGFQNLEGLQAYEPTVSVTTKKSENHVLITVTDNGNGIPQKIVDKIFQPFFTTKPTGQGTGLGLSLSYDIVKAAGGEIKVETMEGKGSTFIIQLPITN